MSPRSPAERQLEVDPAVAPQLGSWARRPGGTESA